MPQWIDEAIFAFNRLWPSGTFWSVDFNIRALLAIILVAIICGGVGSLVVGNRMAFFSDALAHCAFAGVALGLLTGLLLGASSEDFRQYITLIMVGFGIVVGILIAFVREQTSLASDTVIGVFFAGAIGLGAIFVKTIGGRRYFNLENFLFGEPLSVKASDLIWLVLLACLTWACLIWMYNALIFSSFSPSLARSRRVAVRATSYLFIILLGLVINFCLQIVGALLINAMLIVPAATALNLSRNMRQLFWWSVVLSLAMGIGGQWLSWEVEMRDPLSPSHRLQWGINGVIIVLGVAFFAVSMKIGPWIRERSRGSAPAR